MVLNTSKILEENLVQSAFHPTLGDEFTFQQDNNFKKKRPNLHWRCLPRRQWMSWSGRDSVWTWIYLKIYSKTWKWLPSNDQQPMTELEFWKQYMGKCCTIQLWKPIRDLLRKTHSCNHCQRCFFKMWNKSLKLATSNADTQSYTIMPTMKCSSYGIAG